MIGSTTTVRYFRNWYETTVVFSFSNIEKSKNWYYFSPTTTLQKTKLLLYAFFSVLVIFSFGFLIYYLWSRLDWKLNTKHYCAICAWLAIGSKQIKGWEIGRNSKKRKKERTRKIKARETLENWMKSHCHLTKDKEPSINILNIFL